ncbi:MAG: phytanoyl-CoA dioxygenase family protein [Sneathiella sp.]
MVQDNSVDQIELEKHAETMADYIREGEDAAYRLANRGPIKLTPDGQLDPEILDAYWRQGFYVFENVIGSQELAELRADIERVLAEAPVDPDAEIDGQGRPALNAQFEKPAYRFTKPLSDPLGGTSLNNGRHPVKMLSPQAEAGAPEWTISLLDGNLQLMDAALRLAGHAGLLSVAEAICGPDFVPYTDVTFLKEPGLGPSVAWHQDGATHWTAEDWDEGAHGFNSMTQLYPSTAANCVWVIPGSHKLGKVDIKALVEKSGSERIEGAIPMLCQAGDVIVMNRQIVHGSFANSSVQRRVTINSGFFSMKRVMDVTATMLSGAVETFDAARITRRSRIIALAIDARQQKYPNEKRYCYQPFAGQEDRYRWTEENRAKMLKNYNLDNMYI